jgi:hypothetical protein
LREAPVHICWYSQRAIPVISSPRAITTAIVIILAIAVNIAALEVGCPERHTGTLGLDEAVVNSRVHS